MNTISPLLRNIPFSFDSSHILSAIEGMAENSLNNYDNFITEAINEFLNNCLKIGVFLYENSAISFNNFACSCTMDLQGANLIDTNTIDIFIEESKNMSFLKESLLGIRINSINMDESNEHYIKHQRAFIKIKNISRKRIHRNIEKTCNSEEFYFFVESELPIINEDDYPLYINTPILKNYVNYKLGI